MSSPSKPVPLAIDTSSITTSSLIQDQPWSALPSSAIHATIAYPLTSSSITNEFTPNPANLLSSSLPTNIGNSYLNNTRSKARNDNANGIFRNATAGKASSNNKTRTPKSASLDKENHKGSTSLASANADSPSFSFVMETLDSIKTQIHRSEFMPKKKRKKTTPDQFSILSRAFQTNPKPSLQERAALANQLGMTPRAVQVWFQNRRMKYKIQYGSTPEMGTGTIILPLHEADDSAFDTPASITASFLNTATDTFSSNIKSSSGSNNSNSIMVGDDGVSKIGGISMSTSLSLPGEMVAALSMAPPQHKYIAELKAQQHNQTAFSSPIESSLSIVGNPMNHSSAIRRATSVNVEMNDFMPNVVQQHHQKRDLMSGISSAASSMIDPNEIPNMEQLLTPPSSSIITPLNISQSMEQHIQQQQAAAAAGMQISNDHSLLMSRFSQQSGVSHNPCIPQTLSHSYTPNSSVTTLRPPISGNSSTAPLSIPNGHNSHTLHGSNGSHSQLDLFSFGSFMQPTPPSIMNGHSSMFDHQRAFMGTGMDMNSERDLLFSAGHQNGYPANTNNSSNVQPTASSSHGPINTYTNSSMTPTTTANSTSSFLMDAHHGTGLDVNSILTQNRFVAQNNLIKFMTSNRTPFGSL